MNHPEGASGFSGFSGVRGPSLEALDYAKVCLEQAGYAERYRLQKIEADKLEVEKAKLRRTTIMIIAIAILILLPLLTICLKLAGK